MSSGKGRNPNFSPWRPEASYSNRSVSWNHGGKRPRLVHDSHLWHNRNSSKPLVHPDSQRGTRILTERRPQGSSVAETFVNQPGWRLRGVTRKPSIPAAAQWQKKGVEIVCGDMDDPQSLRKALQGATVVFGVTDFWQHLKDSEVQRQAAERKKPINALAFNREIEQGRVCACAVRRADR